MSENNPLLNTLKTPKKNQTHDPTFKAFHKGLWIKWKTPVIKERKTRMKKFKTKNGYIAYKTTTEEMFRIGGFGICDLCGKSHLDGGYLVPVLNGWICPDCFSSWQERGRYYPEDIPYERQKAKEYESWLPFTVEEEQT